MRRSLGATVLAAVLSAGEWGGCPGLVFQPSPVLQDCEVRLFGVAIRGQDEARHFGAAVRLLDLDVGGLGAENVR